MLNTKLQTALNQQINMELGAFYTYLAIAAHFEADALPGFAAWMRHHAEEEMMHAMKIYDYIHERRGKVTLQAIPAPKTTWSSLLEAFEDALHHEEKVTASIHQLVALARDEKDFATDNFLQWFVAEQVEEERVVDDVLQKVKRIGDFSAGIYLLDRELAAGTGPDAEATESAE
jgi:ferritin